MEFSKTSSINMTLYTYCLHTRWTVLLYQNYSKMFITWMFCFAEDNRIISCIDNTITVPDWRKRIFNTLPIVDRSKGYCVHLHYLSLACSPASKPVQQMFTKTSKLSYYFYIVNYYARYNNTACVCDYAPISRFW